MCRTDVTVPAAIDQRNGNGNIAYVTKIMKSTYHTRYSGGENPTHLPTIPVKRRVFHLSDILNGSRWP